MKVMCLRHYSLLVAVLLLAGCANRGMGPQGGIKDTIPPRVLKEIPNNGTLNYDKKRIEILFDEYLQLDNVSKHVLISPPQQRPPEVKAIGKKVILVFDEDLKDSTTYTIDFGDAICDFHEKVPLKGYSLSFSTGDVIDSLEVRGYIVNAEDLNPISGIVVGIHSNKEDSALSTIPFTRIGKSDSNGAFSIKNIREADYRLYGLGDVSRDYLYQPGEGLAFLNKTIHPFCHTDMESDTVWKDTIIFAENKIDTVAIRVVDTIQKSSYTYFEPTDLVLWYFKEDKKRQYFQRCYREEANSFRLLFGAEQEELPIIRALRPSELDSTQSDSTWIDWTQYMLLQTNRTKDTIVYWLTDSMAINMDSLVMEMTYMKSDSSYNLVSKTDTVYAVYRAPRLSGKVKSTKDNNAKESMLVIKSNASAKFELNTNLTLSFATPIADYKKDGLHLFQKIDTTYKPLHCVIESKDTANMVFVVQHDWEPQKRYELRMDSATFRDIYGGVNKAEKIQLALKSLEEYSMLTIRLKEFDSRAIFQLLNAKDEIIREAPAKANGTTFEFLSPGIYYVRLYIDENGDGKWTTGDWTTHRQPEMVYYFPSKLNLRANWDFEEEFDYLARPQLESKPQELLRDVAEQKKR